MIKIKPSSTADTRICDWSNVTKEQLYESSISHLGDVRDGLAHFAKLLHAAGVVHDEDKFTCIDHFHSDFRSGFKEPDWWDKHQGTTRHHLDKRAGVPQDVNLLDVLEHIVDCVMAGMARSGSVYELDLPNGLLQKAFQNTVELLKSEVEVVES